MSTIIFIAYLLLLLFGLALVNVGVWRKLKQLEAKWDDPTGSISPLARIAARLSLMLILNAWLLSAFSYWEGRAVLGTGEPAPVHAFLTRSQGHLLIAIATFIQLMGPLVVAVATMSGLIGILLGRRAGDRSASRVGLAGVLLNGLLVVTACGILGARFLPARNGRPSRRPQAGAEAPQDRQPLRRVNWQREKEVDAFAQPYEERGYQRVVKQVLTVNEPVTQPTIFFGQRLELRRGASADVAIVAQSATIRGVVEGDIEFLGQMLTIDSSAVVRGGVHSLDASLILVHGKVEGEVTGKFRTLRP